MPGSRSVIQGSFPHGLARITAASIQPKTAQQRPGWVQERIALGQRAAAPPAPGAPAQMVQRMTPNGTAIALPPQAANLGRGAGQPLPPDVCQRMEAVFGTSFADVRVHVGPHAAAIGAIAFTHGANVHFAPGQYNPQTAQGLHVLGRELAHVVQQRTGRARNPFGGGLALLQDRTLENEADAMARRASLHPATGRGGLTPVVQRAAAAVPGMTPEAAHLHICAKYGTSVHADGTPYHLWGGNGNCCEDMTGDRDFTAFRDEVDRLGKENGCHTCGRYQGQDTPPNAKTGQPMAHWVCDHQPPLGIIPDADAFRLYPQCHECSNAQWGVSQTYINSFKKHVGRAPEKQDQSLFWGGKGRVHRAGAKYGKSYKE